MNQSVIEMFYEMFQESSKLFPGERSHYKEEMEKLCEIEETLKGTFTEEQKRLFEQFDDAKSDINGIVNKSEFKKGFFTGFVLSNEINEIGYTYEYD